MLYLLQAAFALILLVGLPIALEAPNTLQGEVAAISGAVILVAIAAHGMVRFVRSRKPRSFHDSVMVPPKQPDVESTVIKPRDKV
jgi:hypothetical protein